MPVYSHSRLETFSQCPRRYWYAYLSGIELEQVETIEPFTGSRVHAALEYLYRGVMQGCPPPLPDVLACFAAEWARAWHEGIRIVNPADTVEAYREAGRRALEAYYARYQPFDGAQVLALECKILVDLDGSGRYQLVGYLDRLDRRPDGVYEIHDYKTSRRRPTQDAAELDRQLPLYQIGVQGAYPDAELVELVWHYLRHNLELRSRRSEQQLSALRQRCAAVIEEIEAREPEEGCFPMRPGRLCAWCGFADVCPGAAQQ